MSLETPGGGAGGRITQQQLLTNALDGYNPKLNPYRCKGDGVNNDFASFQDCVNDAGVGGRVVIPPGIYNFYGNQLQGLDFQEWVGRFAFGVAAAPGVPGDGKVQLVWGPTLGASDGLVAGVNQTFSRVCFMGQGAGVTSGGAVRQGSPGSNHSRYHRCQFVAWGTGVKPTSGFYVNFDTCEWNRCAIGVNADTCYNMDFLTCYFRMDPVALGVGVLFNQIRNARFFGGSLESFSPSGGIVLSSGGSGLSVFGTYFESSSVGSGGFGIDNRVDGNSILVEGCWVYLTEISRWVNCSGRDKTVLVGKGNHFIIPVGSGGAPRAYWLPSNATGGLIDIGPDSWSDVAQANTRYFDGLSNPPQQGRIAAPREFNAAGLGFTFDYNLVDIQGRPLAYSPQAAPIATPMPGLTTLANQAGWNPLGKLDTHAYAVVYDGGKYKALGDPTEMSADRGDASVTLTVDVDARQQRFATALTANRTVTLSVTGARNGDRFRIVRTGLGAFTLDVGGLKTLAAGTAAFADVTYDGTAWRLTAFGNL